MWLTKVKFCKIILVDISHQMQSFGFAALIIRGFMISNLPSEFAEDLTDERLHLICERVLDAVQDGINDSSTENDTRWTQGCLRYGRVQGLFQQLTLDKSLPWVSLANATMDFTFKIGNTPIQYIYDDYECPKKGHRLKPNSVENMQLGFDLDNERSIEVVAWRLFVTQDLEDEFPDLKATLVGYDLNQNPLCIWHNEDTAHAPVYAERAEAVELPEPALVRKKSEDDVIDETD
ncbi:hypothetical protein [uncultured Photobacterium sp.]|uniref:hypothetical protein n=1 Tax=uncultured Photobacterium sp. TaxID=173973 RepID=UPI00260DACD9|nr:hypothetical protein [uncultured Photobacterium sp.]